VKSGKLLLVADMIKAGVNVRDRDLDTPYQHLREPPLVLAPNVKMANVLLNAGADVNQLGSNGMTALMAAADKRDIELVHLILSNGANVNAQDKFGDTVLMRVARNYLHHQVGKDLAMLQVLRDAGANASLENSLGQDVNYFARDEKIRTLLKD
jgi:ankyrin repeat protein